MKKYLKQFLSLFSGTSMSQIIPLIVTPFLTRIYTPAAFAEYAIYIAIVTILFVFATGRYELALLSPKNKRNLYSLFFVPIGISLLFNIMLFTFLFLFGKTILLYLNYTVLIKWQLFIPLSLFMMTIFQSVYFLFNKKELYKLMAVNLIIQSLAIATSNIIIGVYNPTVGLIGGYITGQFISMILILINLKRLKIIEWNLVDFSTIKKQMKEYINFPKYLIISNLSNRLSLQSTVLLFTNFYDSNQVGNFSLTNRVLKVPLSFIGNTVSQIFRQKAATQLSENEECKKLYLGTLLLLFTISVIPFTLIYLYSEEIFVFILGNQWSEAGKYAKYLVPMLFAQFCIGPLTSLFWLDGKQKWDMYWQFTTLVLTVSTITFTSVYFESIEVSIISYSIVYVLMYCISFLLSSRIAFGHIK